MAYLSTMAMIESGADRPILLRWHFQTNHDPPIPVEWIPCSEWVIDRALAGEDMSAPAPVPEGFQQMSAAEVFEGLHLGPFAQEGVEDQSEETT